MTMAPKSWPPRRCAKTTARKTVPLPPPVPYQCTSASSPESSLAPPRPTTATARSALGSSLKEDCVLISPDIKYNPKIENLSSPSEKGSSAANSNPEPQDKIKKIVTRSGKKIRAGDKVRGHDAFNLGSTGQVLRSCSAQDTILVRPKSPVAEGAGSELEGGGSGECLTGPGTMVVANAGVEVKGKVGDEALAEVVKAAIEAGGSTKVGECKTRKVVKKTVRIVKKIVKRRVPKRVVTGSERSEETKGVEVGGNTERTELDSIEVEKVDSDCRVEKIDSSSAVGNEGTESIANVDIFKERDESLEHAMHELNSIEVGAVDHSGTVSVETEENSKPNCNVTLEIENEGLKETQGQAEEITKVNLSAESIVTGEEDVLELRDSTSGSSSQGFVAGENDGNESLMVEMKSGDCFEDLTAGPIQEKRRDGEEKIDAGLNGALALSGEMEALERRKRRRTEIFVGGLDKDTKEEDIRKLFESVGEVTQVRLVKNSDSGKNKGFAFLRFASAADAKKALEKFSTVEVFFFPSDLKVASSFKLLNSLWF